MSWQKRISNAFLHAPVLPLDQNSRYVLISDCHRGIGNSNDNFLKNQHLYSAALNHYLKTGYTYLELGDGDELWENHSLARIINIHSDVFRLFKEFHDQDRLYLLYGNHDHCKKSCRYCHRHCSTCHCEYQAADMDLLPNFHFLSGIILKDIISGKELYLTHGHQADFWNSTLAPLPGILVRCFWKPLEAMGVPDPTSAARNYTRKQKTEKRLAAWACQEQKLLITGHTHRPMIGRPDSPYFNTGSCVHPRCITCIEITNRCITLVKWTVRTREDFSLYVAREVLEGPVSLDVF